MSETSKKRGLDEPSIDPRPKKVFVVPGHCCCQDENKKLKVQIEELEEDFFTSESADRRRLEEAEEAWTQLKLEQKVAKIRITELEIDLMDARRKIQYFEIRPSPNLNWKSVEFTAVRQDYDEPNTAPQTTDHTRGTASHSLKDLEVYKKPQANEGHDTAPEQTFRPGSKEHQQSTVICNAVQENIDTLLPSANSSFSGSTYDDRLWPQPSEGEDVAMGGPSTRSSPFTGRATEDTQTLPSPIEDMDVSMREDIRHRYAGFESASRSGSPTISNQDEAWMRRSTTPAQPSHNGMGPNCLPDENSLQGAAMAWNLSLLPEDMASPKRAQTGPWVILAEHNFNELCGDAMQQLIRLSMEFYKIHNFCGKQKPFTNLDRPPQLSEWIRRHRPLDGIPSKPLPIAKFLKWWAHMKDEYDKRGPAGLNDGGPNGWPNVLIFLRWWGDYIMEGRRKALSDWETKRRLDEWRKSIDEVSRTLGAVYKHAKG